MKGSKQEVDNRRLNFGKKIAVAFQNTHKKLTLLNGLYNREVEDQFLVELFLSESISIFEGLIHKVILLLKENDDILFCSDKCSDLISKGIINQCNKGEMFEKLLRKTLNDPFLVSNIFEILLGIPVKEFNSSLFQYENFGKSKEQLLKIRNAHIHRNGIHEEGCISLNEAREFIDKLLIFLDYFGLVISSPQIKAIQRN
ncbi:hypothetical protein [Acinetobacter sp. ANC 4640]